MDFLFLPEKSLNPPQTHLPNFLSLTQAKKTHPYIRFC
uniref:Uncharacterized protein n=1 Tax=Rhizophora mucronata TaxID=61149 RepID=A0A2P2IHV1_RHIMU